MLAGCRLRILWSPTLVNNRSSLPQPVLATARQPALRLMPYAMMGGEGGKLGRKGMSLDCSQASATLGRKVLLF